ncbi:MAG: TetR/AcrR family transcriptional regulator [Chloroflexota bacterium]|nr:TetR/AcrR family transcriptional regulator [Chloroflexota bacterium]
MSKSGLVDVHGRSQPTNRSGPEALDERVRRSKEVVLGATFELLTESGLGGVSVDEVSRRSGVAKTTIYRHWATRSDLILDACSRISAEQEVPDTGGFESDVTALLTGLAKLLATARWSTVVPSIIDAAERDPELAQIHSRIQMGHTAPLQVVIARAVRNGEIPASTDPSDLIAALVGPLFYRRWFSREPLDEAFVSSIVRTAINAR